MSSEPGAELLDTTQAGARAGVSSRTIYKWKEAGHIAFKGALVDRASLDAYIQERNAARRQKAFREIIETSEPGAEPGSELVTYEASALTAELRAEVQILGQTVAELTAELVALRPVYGPDPPTSLPPLFPDGFPLEEKPLTLKSPQQEPSVQPGGFRAWLRRLWEGGA